LLFASGSHSNWRVKRKKGLGLPLSGTCPAVSADKLPCYKFLLKGRSDFAVQAGADLASQLAQNIAEAFLWRRPSDWIRLGTNSRLSKTARISTPQ